MHTREQDPVGNGDNNQINGEGAGLPRPLYHDETDEFWPHSRLLHDLFTSKAFLPPFLTDTLPEHGVALAHDIV